MGLHANPDPRFDGKETRLTNPQRPAPIPEIDQAGGAALQTGMPVFRPAPPAKMVVGTGQDGCRSSGPSTLRATSVVSSRSRFFVNTSGLRPGAPGSGLKSVHWTDFRAPFIPNRVIDVKAQRTNGT